MKHERHKALAVAAVLCRILKPFTARLVVAGSLRWGKPQVGDIEILYVPKFDEVKEDLFQTRQQSQVDLALEVMLGEGLLSQRTNINGSPSWGVANKLAVHCASGIPVDFFATTEPAWWNYLVCRTGPAESNIKIAAAAKRKGWAWHPYRSGFTDQDGKPVAVQSEAEVFQLVGLRYLPPAARV